MSIETKAELTCENCDKYTMFGVVRLLATTKKDFIKEPAEWRISEKFNSDPVLCSDECEKQYAEKVKKGEVVIGEMRMRLGVPSTEDLQQAHRVAVSHATIDGLPRRYG